MDWLKKEFKKIGGKVITGSITKINQDETGITSLYLDTQEYIKQYTYIPSEPTTNKYFNYYYSFTEIRIRYSFK